MEDEIDFSKFTCVACGDIDASNDTRICSRCKNYKDMLQDNGQPYKPYEVPEHVAKRMRELEEEYKREQQELKDRERAWLLYTDEERAELIEKNLEDDYSVIKAMIDADDFRQLQERIKAREIAEMGGLKRERHLLKEAKKATKQLSNKQLREQNVPKDGICPTCGNVVTVSANWIGNGVITPMICRNCYNESQRKPKR